MKFAVVVFPGSNCDHDTHHALTHILGQQAELVWHRETDLNGADVVILPGGFSYGDYLRTGAIAQFSPIMSRVCDFANNGGPLLGICNGFQILLEVGLLEGGMVRNRRVKFLCQHLNVSVEETDTPFTRLTSRGQVLRMPIAHGDGNYCASPETLRSLEANRQIIFRYCDISGSADEHDHEANPNGSINAIAGICNKARNVVGLMPHPERACESILGSTDGLVILDSVVSMLTNSSS